MNRLLIILFIILILVLPEISVAQCSMCTKTAQQLGEKPALGMNQGILYLMLMPFAIIGYIGFRWYKNRNEID
jgi:hypothetical protein